MAQRIIYHCNKCGKEVYGNRDFSLRYYKTLGYGSEFDGETVSIDLCHSCMDELIKSCSISPILTDAEKDDNPWEF